MIPRAFARDVSATYATRIATLAITFSMSVVVARALGPHGRGLFALATTVTGIGLQLTNLGVHSSNVLVAARDPSRVAELVGNSLGVSLALGALATALGAFVLAFAPDVAPVSGQLLTLALIAIPIGLAYLLLQSILLGLGRLEENNVGAFGLEVFTARQRFVEAMHGAGIGPRHDQNVGIGLGVDRGADLHPRLGPRDHLLAAGVATLLRADLVLDHHAGCAGTRVFDHRALDVERVAVAGMCPAP